MSTVVEMYTGMLDEMEPGWRDNPGEAQAGVAAAICVLVEGEWKPAEIVDFDPAIVQTAYDRLDANGYFETLEDGRRVLVVDKDCGIEDGLWWAILQLVANGFMVRASEENA